MGLSREARAEPRAATRADLPDGGRFAALDALRGVAALGVAWYHIPALTGPGATAWHGQLRLFVDFFFVLSGFVIASAYGERLRAGFPLPRFMLLRLGRLYPVHFAMVLLYLAAELAATMLPLGMGREPFGGARDPAMLPASLLLIQAFVYPGVDTWNVQSWSISVELWLYLLAGLLFRLAGARATGIFAALALAAIAMLAWGADQTYGWVARGLAGFGIGTVAWALHGRIGPRRSTPWAAAVLEGVALLALVTPLVLAPSPGFADLLFAVAVLVFAREAGPLSRLLVLRPFAVLGAISYSLYMVHGFVIGRMFDIAGLLQRHLGLTLVAPSGDGADALVGPAWQSAGLTAVFLLVACVTGWLLWRVIEEPSRQWSRRVAARVGVAGEERAAPTN